MMKGKTILLVEDDYVDVTSVKRALAKLDVEHELHVAHNGVDALSILNGNDSNGTKVLPDIILLDLNMPKMNGLEFLGIIKSYYSLKNIKVFVMTTSAEEYDIVSAQQLGIYGYILKPLNFENSKKKDKFSESVKKLKDELLSDKPMRSAMPVFFAGGSASGAVKAKWLLLKKAGASSLSYAAGLKTLAVAAAAAAVVTVINQAVPSSYTEEPVIPIVAEEKLPAISTDTAVFRVEAPEPPVQPLAHHKTAPAVSVKSKTQAALPVNLLPVSPHPIKISVSVAEDEEDEPVNSHVIEQEIQEEPSNGSGTD